jgi:heme-degrading monooxygenase HmoA
MYGRIVSGLMQPGRMDEGISIYRDSIAPTAKQQKGCNGVFLLADRKTGKFVSLVLWDTEADMIAGEASGYLREQIAKAAPTFAGPPATEHYEVAVQA